MPEEPHSRIISHVAKETLGAIGLKRSGRSRLWYDDHGWWLGMVEFTPSAHEKGTRLVVTACWLWDSLTSAFTFDTKGREERFVVFQSEPQFEPAVRRLASIAAAEILRMRERYPNVAWVATDPDPRVDADAYRRNLHAGIAWELTG